MRSRSWIILTVVIILVASASLAIWQLRTPLAELTNLTLTHLAPAPTISFAVVGDNHGDNPIYRQILAQLPSYHPAFLINLADVTDLGTAAEFSAVHGLEKDLPFPVYHTVGNHDILVDPSRQLFSQAFDQAPWQSFDYGRIHVVILDNADRKVGFPAASLDWLAKDLAAHQHQIIFVAYHRPFDLPLAQVLGDDETTASTKTNERLVELMTKYHVRYILTAHIHTYLRYSVEGIPAVISGGGGGEAQAIIGGPSHDFFHFLIVTIRNNDITIDVHRITSPI